MKEKESYFALAPELLKKALPKRVELTDEDKASIKLPPRRYEEIEQEIVDFYHDLDIRLIPLDPLAIAQAMGCGPISYRLLGRIAYPILKEASPDAVTCWVFGKPFVLFDDRMPTGRCAFTMMHELAHIRLGHREHSKLAEIEANYFAATALCPLPLLEKSRLRVPAEIAKAFGISDECAQNRLKRLSAWQKIPEKRRNLAFDYAVENRLSFKVPIQLDLFNNLEHEEKAQ
jgi:Zn-dependent peptidase ImmA (M78 family)